jgi:hypothetical protein
MSLQDSENDSYSLLLEELDRHNCLYKFPARGLLKANIFPRIFKKIRWSIIGILAGPALSPWHITFTHKSQTNKQQP